MKTSLWFSASVAAFFLPQLLFAQDVWGPQRSSQWNGLSPALESGPKTRAAAPLRTHPGRGCRVPVLLPDSPDHARGAWKEMGEHFKAREFSSSPPQERPEVSPGREPVDWSDVLEVDAPAIERAEIEQLVRLGKLGSGVVLHSNNNRLSVDAWRAIGKAFKARKIRGGVDWLSSTVHTWDKTLDPPQKREEPMHAGHFKTLLEAGLRMVVYEPVVSGLTAAPRQEGEPAVRTEGYDYNYLDNDREKERAQTELGNTWARLAEDGFTRGNPVTLKIRSNRFSEADMLEILRQGGRIELNIAGATRFDFQGSAGYGDETGYNKIRAFLTKVQSQQLASRFTVRYNGKSMDLFLRDPNRLEVRFEDSMEARNPGAPTGERP
jgi:hypothetical protein